MCPAMEVDFVLQIYEVPDVPQVPSSVEVFELKYSGWEGANHLVHAGMCILHMYINIKFLLGSQDLELYKLCIGVAGCFLKLNF